MSLEEQGIYVFQNKGCRSFQIFPGSSLSAVKHTTPRFYVKMSAWTSKTVFRTEPQKKIISTSKTKSWSLNNYDIVIGERTMSAYRGSLWSSKRFFTLPSGLKCVAKKRSMTSSFVVTELQSNTTLATYENTSFSYRKAGVLRLYALGHSQDDLIGLFMAIVVMIRIEQDRRSGAAAGAAGGGGGGGGGC